MLTNILNLEGVQTIERKVLKEVNGGSGCACGSNWTHGNEYGGGEGMFCDEC
ncbi:hypothetical protein U6A24_17930 [Aquimarina gracilis]|uniref:Natural product n=1 Tax=Aquimarina gracilis TaxID=874422 RepID=A0ABU5ZZV7_9FLAO|nr:hypothetical protein [Aquimarina gracilis]MEB3347360.1 hypothetical protein [Aquimarina gracilis]